MSKHFVWVAGLLGPQPQIWHDDVTGKSIFKCKLESDEENLSVDQLAEKYKANKDNELTP